MFEPAELEARYTASGAAFLTSAATIAERAAALRGIVFDWDGVFNAGVKGEHAPSPFSESDSMGTNLLRYALWLGGHGLPVTAIVTGAANPDAIAFARREHFHAIYPGVRNKADAVTALCQRYGISQDQLAVVFDDVNDLPMASGCGLRFLVRRKASPLLAEYVAREGLADFVTAGEGGQHAVREVTELLLGLTGRFEQVVRSRTASDESYVRYFTARQAVETKLVNS